MRGMRLMSFCLISLVLLAGRAMATEDEAYRLDAGDVIRVAVWGHDDLQAEARVAPDGRVTLPLLGEVPVRGCTLAEVTRLLTAKFGEFIREPQVIVSLATPRQLSIKVFGQVTRPGSFLVNPGASIAELIAMAGGPTKRAALEHVQLLRAGDPARAETVPQGKDDKFGLGSATRGPQLAEGDVIYVPETGRIDWEFVFGVLGGLLTLKELVT